MSLLAWCGALAIGLVLGLLGSGGSILTVPVLVYLVHLPEKVAIASSLAVVGSIALVGGGLAALRRRVDGRSVLLFGGPGMLGTYGGAWLAGFVSGSTQLVVFAFVMWVAAWSMFRRRADIAIADAPPRVPAIFVVLQGVTTGLLTGFVGVGGGFLIVPALVVLGHLPMRVAVGTSLVIIALTAFSGFATYLQVLARVGLSVDWHIIWTFSAVGAIGSVAGNAIGARVPQRQLQQGFAGLLVVMGALILWQRL